MREGICKLCLHTKTLQHSHFLPAALYRKSRQEGARNPNPLLLSAVGNVQTSQQIRDYVLCRECEQLFSSKGERYAMSQVQHRGRFPLLQTLRAVPPSKVSTDYAWYTRATTASIDREKLTYFALSVFWRASAHQWPKGETNVNLGAHQEPVRKYLLGEAALPSNLTLLLVVCTDVLAQNTFYLPSLGSTELVLTYTFQARGMNFFLNIGLDMPPMLRALCLITGDNGWIIARSCEEKVLEGASRLSELRSR